MKHDTEALKQLEATIEDLDKRVSELKALMRKVFQDCPKHKECPYLTTKQKEKDS